MSEAAEAQSACPLSPLTQTVQPGPPPPAGMEGPNCDVPINECVRGTAACSANATCLDTPSGYTCQCVVGARRRRPAAGRADFAPPAPPALCAADPHAALPPPPTNRRLTGAGGATQGTAAPAPPTPPRCSSSRRCTGASPRALPATPGATSPGPWTPPVGGCTRGGAGSPGWLAVSCPCGTVILCNGHASPIPPHFRTRRWVQATSTIPSTPTRSSTPAPAASTAPAATSPCRHVLYAPASSCLRAHKQGRLSGCWKERAGSR